MTEPHEEQVTPEGQEPTAPAPEGVVAEEPVEAADAADSAVPAEPGDPGAAGGEAEPAEAGEPVGEADEVARLETALAERTADLQRLQAEFLNYKRRVDRDRELVKQNATYAALAPITEVLDTIDRAREHAPLEEGFRSVADQLERTVAGLGLTKFGAPGDPFDPALHEALSHVGQDPEVTVTTCKVIAKAGYRIGDRVVRAAQVLVVDPAEPAGE